MAGEVITQEEKFIGRWRHRDKLVFRVWPKFKETHRAIVKQKVIPINGLMPTKDGHLEAWHNTSKAQAYRFELCDADVDTLAAAARVGAKLDLQRMVVRAPGTLDEAVKKECWLEIPFTAYPDARTRTKSTACRSIDKNIPDLRNLFGSDLKAELKKKGYEYGKILVVETEDEIDEDLICHEIVKHNAIIVFLRITQTAGVSGAAAKTLIARAKYWVVPGRRPDEDGGLFRGYQFCDRFVRWNHSFGPGEHEAFMREILDRAHEATREKGRNVRRMFFHENVINKFSERLGMPRQRVTSQFFDDGVFDWMMRSVDGIKPIQMRETKCLLKARVTDAVYAIEFYYRALGVMRQKAQLTAGGAQ